MWRWISLRRSMSRLTTSPLVQHALASPHNSQQQRANSAGSIARQHPKSSPGRRLLWDPPKELQHRPSPKYPLDSRSPWVSRGTSTKFRLLTQARGAPSQSAQSSVEPLIPRLKMDLNSVTSLRDFDMSLDTSTSIASDTPGHNALGSVSSDTSADTLGRCLQSMGLTLGTIGKDRLGCASFRGVDDNALFDLLTLHSQLAQRMAAVFDSAMPTSSIVGAESWPAVSSSRLGQICSKETTTCTAVPAALSPTCGGLILMPSGGVTNAISSRKLRLPPPIFTSHSGKRPLLLTPTMFHYRS